MGLLALGPSATLARRQIGEPRCPRRLRWERKPQGHSSHEGTQNSGGLRWHAPREWEEQNDGLPLALRA